MLDKMKDALGDKVKEVRLSSRLKSHPVCLVSDEGLSMEMEKVLNQMPNQNEVKAGKILEINPTMTSSQRRRRFMTSIRN